jgi:hypothetical protein
MISTDFEDSNGMFLAEDHMTKVSKKSTVIQKSMKCYRMSAN